MTILTFLLAILVMGFATILQSTIVVNINLLFGSADLVLLVLLGWILQKNVTGEVYWGLIAGFLVGFISDQPIWLTVLGYTLVVSFALFLQTRIWDIELLTLFTVTLIGSFLLMGLTFIYRIVIGVPLPVQESFTLIILPSMLLNALFALPIYGLMGEITKGIYQGEVEL